MKKFVIKIKSIIIILVLILFNASLITAQSDEVYWNLEVPLGTTKEGHFSGFMFKFHQEDWMFAIGYRYFNYLPDDLPADYSPAASLFSNSTRSLNNNSLFYLGTGRYVTNIHKPARILVQGGGVIGGYHEAENFRRIPGTSSGLFNLYSQPSNYTFTSKKGFVIGGHLLSKMELCTRAVSFGINLESFLTSKKIAFGAGLSLGFGRMRKRIE
jgi:hypothetical protein